MNTPMSPAEMHLGDPHEPAPLRWSPTEKAGPCRLITAPDQSTNWRDETHWTDLSGALDQAIGADQEESVFPQPAQVLGALAQTFARGEGPRAPAHLRPESFHVSSDMARQIAQEAADQEEQILRIIEAEPMGIERLAELLGTKAGTLRPLVRVMEGCGLLETHRDRLMLGPVHMVAPPCCETALQLVLSAFTRPQINRNDVKQATGLDDDTIRQAMARLSQRGTVRLKFVGSMAIYELLADVGTTQRNLPAWATAQRRPARTRPQVRTSYWGPRPATYSD